jgi:hypothetical protein
MTDDAQGEATKGPDSNTGTTPSPSLVMIVTSYVVAVISWLAMSPPWSIIPDSWTPLLDGPVTGVIAWIAFASWVAAMAFAFWRFRLRAWPMLLGAPLALYQPVQVFLEAIFCATGLGCP